MYNTKKMLKMKAKVKLTDRFSGRHCTIITYLVNDYSDNYVFKYSSLTPSQRRKIEDYFGKYNAYYTSADIIKIL